MAPDLTSGQRTRAAVRVTGVVQGVGFRPFVYALATGLGLTGHVGNDDGGVFAEVEGGAEAVADFVEGLRSQAPPLSRVESVQARSVPVRGDAGFAIVASRRSRSSVTLVPPDTAVCADCLREVADPADRRHRYPFTACTYCGPRYTIVTGLPYDRPFTTMAEFPLCPDCRREYEDPSNRRFHAQPTACPACGPTLSFVDASPVPPGTGRPGTSWADPTPDALAAVTDAATDTIAGPHGDAALAAAQDAIAAGRVVAVKGIGGYHLACDARDPAVVARLRRRKRRGDKPFAVMARSLDVLAGLVHLDDEAIRLLTSRQAPIVLVPARLADPTARALRDAVAVRNPVLGVMLPYSPLHHLLMSPHPDRPGAAPPDVLVMTSANLSDEPLATDPAEAEQRLAGIADAYLHHDRGIHVPCDDSVVQSVDGRMQPVRRSRGFAPMPVDLPVTAPPMLAVGGEIKTTLCLALGQRAWLSQHIGDTANLQTLALLERTADTLAALTRVRPEVLAADLHPGYLSRRWAGERAAASGVDLVLVQHHHAHLAALLAEHRVPGDEPVLGFAFDGTGYGLDGTIWGGEVLLGSYRRVDRVGHLRPVRLPGGDAAIRRPARSGLAHLTTAELDWDERIPCVAAADPVERRVLARMLATGTGCTPTTSMGRLFDAVAALVGVRQDAAYEGQAAIELEALAAGAWPSGGVGDPEPGPGCGPLWRLGITGTGTAADPLVLDPAPVLAAAVRAVLAGDPPRPAALAFHVAVAQAVVDCAVAVRGRTGVDRVGLTGGVFQNVLLTGACRDRLVAAGFDVLVHRVVPPNDGGLALGQVAVAASGGGQRPAAAGGG